MLRLHPLLLVPALVGAEPLLFFRFVHLNVCGSVLWYFCVATATVPGYVTTSQPVFLELMSVFFCWQFTYLCWQFTPPFDVCPPPSLPATSPKQHDLDGRPPFTSRPAPPFAHAQPEAIEFRQAPSHSLSAAGSSG